MKPTQAHLHFHDEFRHIKSGKRLVEIKRDDNYTYVRPVARTPRHWGKMPNDRFKEIFGNVWAVT